MDPRNGPEASPIASVLSRSDKRRANAERVMSALGLFERWAVYGRPVLVGSVAYDLVVAPDIDMEIYCERPRIEDGFTVAARLALEPGVQKVRFSNEMQGPDQGLYWQLQYLDPISVRREMWKIDMWVLGEDHPGPRSADLVKPMQEVLTPETRAAILLIKEATVDSERVNGIDVYRAVLDGGVRTVEEFDAWIAAYGSLDLSTWRPRRR